MEILLTGKNALVGGSSKGIGRAIAERLAASGANVTLMARSEDLMAQIVVRFGTFLASKMDLSCPRQFLALCGARFGEERREEESPSTWTPSKCQNVTQPATWRCVGALTQNLT